MSNIWLHLIAASTYGSGDYSALNYNGTTSPAPLIAIGPLSLPDTGAGWSVLLGAVALAIAGGWMMWLWQKRRSHRVAKQSAQ